MDTQSYHHWCQLIYLYFQFNTTNTQGYINPVNAFQRMWPYYMILNIVIGGPWPGPPDNSTAWPQEMVVDWIRVDQLKTYISYDLESSGSCSFSQSNQLEKDVVFNLLSRND